VRGFLMTDTFKPGADPAAGLVPAEQAALVADDLDRELDAQVAAFGGFASRDPQQARRVARNSEALRANLERDLMYVHTARRVQQALAPDFLAVAHRAVDGLEHKTMLHHALARRPAGTPIPRHLGERLTPERIAASADVVSQSYAIFDQELGLLLAELGDSVVIVVSDHGHDLDGTGHQFGPPGILVLAGGPIARGSAPRSATVFDILPSVLHLMGLPIPQGLEGRVLVEILDPAWASAHPVRTLAPDPGSPSPFQPSAPLEGVSGEQLRELRELGYVE
jgi:arylsulfatase A-like enzyme